MGNKYEISVGGMNFTALEELFVKGEIKSIKSKCGGLFGRKRLFIGYENGKFVVRNIVLTGNQAGTPSDDKARAALDKKE
jgi:hypothetical protein